MTTLSLNPSQFYFPRSFGNEGNINWGFIASLLIHGVLAALLIKAVFPVDEQLPQIPEQVITLVEWKPMESHQSKAVFSKSRPAVNRQTKQVASKPKPVVSRRSSVVSDVKQITNHQSPVASAAAAPAPVTHAPSPESANQSTQSTSYSAPSFDAAYLRNPAPDYPAAAKRRRMQGMVLLSVTVSPDGDALVVRLKKSSGFAPLDMAAENAVKRWQFIPAKRGENTVTAQVVVPVEFRLAS
jgi:protein TonB